ncbi:hypothetical protein Tco_1525852 [Tanacetum coccineum]
MVTTTMTESWWLSRGGGGSTGGVVADSWWCCDDIAGGVAKVVMADGGGGEAVVTRMMCHGGDEVVMVEIGGDGGATWSGSEVGGAWQWCGGWLMPTAAVGRNIFRWRRRNSGELIGYDMGSAFLVFQNVSSHLRSSVGDYKYLAFVAYLNDLLSRFTVSTLSVERLPRYGLNVMKILKDQIEYICADKKTYEKLITDELY